MAGRVITVRGIPYRIEKEIGHGLHSLVYSAHDIENNQPVAIKVISFLHGSRAVKADTESRRQTYGKEIKMLLYLQELNPYVVRVFNYDHNNQYGIIVMERGVTLRDTLVTYLLEGKRMPGYLIRHFWSQMVEAIHYLQVSGFVHGDCKPENFIQIGPNRETLRLIDMGISYYLPDNITSQLQPAMGTPDYVSPEMIKTRVAHSDHSRSGYKSDVWALGVILYEMAFGVRPLEFLRNNDAKINFLAHLQRDIKIPKHPDRSLRNILKSCLRTNPNRRITIEKILRHKFLTKTRKEDSFSSYTTNFETSIFNTYDYTKENSLFSRLLSFI